MPWLGRFSLDIKLGARRLRKSWGLTVIGGLAMTIAIAIAAGGYRFVTAFSGVALPLDEGDRIVAIQAWSQAEGRAQSTAPADFERWRDQLRSVEDVGAFRTVRRNLSLSGDAPSPPGSEQSAASIVEVAEMSAAGFRLARVPPLHGRPLVEADERVDAEPVVVIGYDVWRARFAADPAIVGRRVRLDGTAQTVIGVMPEGFAFPINHHFWIPLRADSPTGGWESGPELVAFGRLAPGVTLDSARAELTTLGLVPRAAEAGTTAADLLYPRIRPYAQAFVYLQWSGLILLLLTLLLVPPCANIAILVYARTVVRQEEFAIRAALGASRRRIVAQLFLEMLLLSAAAACAALLLVQFMLRGFEVGGNIGENPFWMDFGVSPGSALYVGALALLAGVIAGVIPAIRATRDLQSGLRARSGGSGLSLGNVWSAMIIAQIALAMVVLPLAVNVGWGVVRPGLLGPGFAAEDYMAARVQFSGTTGRFAELQLELVRRLEAEAAIAAVAVSQTVPGAEPSRQVFEVEPLDPAAPVEDGLAGATPFAVAANRVGRGFFEVFDVPLLAGRAFGAGDFEPGRNPVLINRTFAERFASGQEGPLGRRIRQRVTQNPASEPWYEIVGVVADFPANDETSRLYLPMPPSKTLTLTFRINPGAEGAADRFREIAASLDAGLLVAQVAVLDTLYVASRLERTATAFLLAVVTLSVLLLSAAGMYALMSFSVNQRRREIGLRSALGAQSVQLLAGTFRAPLCQIAAGTAVGLVAAYFTGGVIPIEELGGRRVPGVWALAALAMLVVAALAVAGPARRALKLAPTEALREGG